MSTFQDAGMSGAEFSQKHGRTESGAKPNGHAGPMSYILLRDLKPNLTSNDIVKDIIPRNAFVEAHAVSGGGKTAIIVDLCLHIADGREYRGRRVEQQPVVYIALEGHKGIDNRVIAARDQLEIADAPFALVKAIDNFRDPEACLKAAALARQMMQQHSGACPVIVLDTYPAALGAGGSDCEPRDVTAFIENVKSHLLGAGCTVIINHHFGKDASRGGRRWSGLNAALDVELEIDRDGDLRTMRVTKSRDSSDVQPAFCYRFHARELGINNYGEPVTAVVVEHLADEDTTKRGKRLSPKARAALNILWDMIKDRGQSFPMADQPGKRCVILDDWERACTAPGAISKCAEERDRKKQFRGAREELEAGKSIVCDGDDRRRVYPFPKDGRK
jgi:hypothetical protein